MVTIQESELKEGILLAIDRAKNDGRPILVSEVRQIAPIDPLLFYYTGKERFYGERFFWKDPSDEIYLAGNGIINQFQSDQATDRFFHVEKAWKRFIENALIDNPYKENGVGPLMFGGFSFDPSKEKSGLWSKYGDALFHLSKYMLSVIKGKTYLTTNVVCTQHDDLSLYHKVMQEREELLNSIPLSMSSELPHLSDMKEISPESWKETVAEILPDLEKGSLKKVVLARELRLFFEEPAEPEAALSHLNKAQHESFIFSFESNGDSFIGASPERLVKKQGKNIFSTCLAGSIGRGKTEEEDRALGDQLLSDQKNLIEHHYVVEMIREALEETCKRVEMPDQPQLLKIRDIQHLYTPVVGISKEDASLIQMVERLHPTPALGGLPKYEAVEKIRSVEELDRGFYAAPLGWMDYKGNGEFAVAIRSALLQGKEASLFAGCGVVSDSDPESEFLETSLKFRPMLNALGGNQS